MNGTSTAEGNRRRYERYIKKKSYRQLIGQLDKQLARLLERVDNNCDMRINYQRLVHHIYHHHIGIIVFGLLVSIFSGYFAAKLAEISRRICRLIAR